MSRSGYPCSAGWIVLGIGFGLAAGCATEPPPTYHGEVRPILVDRCVGCHTEGSIAPFPLDTYAHAASRADALVRATSERRMPPWLIPNDGSCQTYDNANWLTPEELEAESRPLGLLEVLGSGSLFGASLFGALAQSVLLESGAGEP